MATARVGDRVRVRSEDKTIKAWGRIVEVETHAEPIEVTLGGSLGGPPPDPCRTFAQGRKSVRLIIELES